MRDQSYDKYKCCIMPDSETIGCVAEKLIMNDKTRSLSCPCDSCQNPVIPAESGGIRWNHFWQGALPKLPFRGPVIPVELSHSGIETGMVLEWTGTESGRMQLNRFIYLFYNYIFYLYFNNICQMYCVRHITGRSQSHASTSTTI